MPLYTDLDLNLTRHPTTGDILKIVDAEAVKQSIQHIVLGNRFDKPFDDNFGGSLKTLLFMPFNPAVRLAISKVLAEKITQYEPRVELEKIDVQDNKLDQNKLSVEISYSVRGYSQQKVQIAMERAR